MLKIDLSNFYYIINFEYVSLLILVILLVFMIINKNITMKRGKIFFAFVSILTIAVLFNILKSLLVNQMIKNNNYDNILLLNFFQTTYLIFLFTSIFGFITYIAYLTCGLSYINNSKRRSFLFYLPAFIILIITFVNYFTCSILRFSFENNTLYFNINIPLLIVFIIIAAIYLIMSIILMVKFKNLYDKKQIIAISFLLPITFIGFIVEIATPSVLLLEFMMTISVILVQTVLESIEDIMDLNTNLDNLDEFNKVIKKAFYSNDINKTVVLIKIENIDDLYNSYSKAVVEKYLLDLTKYFKAFKKEYKIKDELYSLNNGYYASVCDKDEFVDTTPEDFVISSIRKDYCFDFIPIFKMCYFEILNDFESYDEVFNFVNNYRKSINFEKNNIVYSEIKNDKKFVIANHLNQIIDTAIKENEFKVYYQPIYSIKDKKFKSAEALVRLISKEYGFISPGDFIPYAENNGKIAEIDSFVMDEVFKFVSSDLFNDLGLEYIDINLSMAECSNPKLVERIIKLKDKYNVNPKNINLEITESFDISELDVINDNLNRLTKIGFELSLDDFGSGYSNIKRFSNLPISIVKIDKSLVDECNDKKMRKILDYSFSVVNTLNKQTVVEGVETKEQLDLFIEYGATYIQGYYFSKPLEFNSYIEFLREN